MTIRIDPLWNFKLPEFRVVPIAGRLDPYVISQLEEEEIAIGGTE